MNKTLYYTNQTYLTILEKWTGDYLNTTFPYYISTMLN